MLRVLLNRVAQKQVTEYWSNNSMSYRPIKKIKLKTCFYVHFFFSRMEGKPAKKNYRAIFFCTVEDLKQKIHALLN